MASDKVLCKCFYMILERPRGGKLPLPLVKRKMSVKRIKQFSIPLVHGDLVVELLHRLVFQRIEVEKARAAAYAGDRLAIAVSA